MKLSNANCAWCRRKARQLPLSENVSSQSHNVPDQMAGNRLAADDSALITALPLPTRRVAGGYQPICVLAVCAVLLALPMLLYGPMPAGHDTYEHLNFTRHFAKQFWDGELSPRWLLNMNHGLGSPTFFVYPPLPSYVYALLEPVGEALHFSAFNVMALLALFASGVAAYLWIGTGAIASRGIALFVAVLYMLMPYHLAADFYRRTALPECWALVWMPLVLYFATQITKAKRGAVVALAVAYCLLLLSHPVSAFIFSLIPVLVAVTLAAPDRKLESALSVGGGMLLGIGLAGFYFLPALFHAKYFPVSRLGLGLVYNLLPFDKTMLHSGGYVRALSLNVIDMAALIALSAVVAWPSALPEQRKQIGLWVSVSVAAILLMSHSSTPLWRRFPWLLDGIQFPWRLNILLCIAALPVIAIFLSQLSWPLEARRALAMAFGLLLVMTWLIPYWNVVNDYSRSPTAFTTDPVSESDGWFKAWQAPGTDSASALQASLGPQVKFVSGSGAVNVRHWKPRDLEFETYSETGGAVRINQFYYPAWTAQLVGEARPLDLEAALPSGLLQVQVPPGHQAVRMEIPVGRAEHLGRWLSLLCVLLCVVLVWQPAKNQ